MKRYAFKTAILVIALAMVSCLGDIPMKIEFNMTPEALNDGWEIAAPEDVGLDRARLEKAYDKFFSDKIFNTAYSLLVVRNGKLVAEGYRRGLDDRERLNNIKSSTKSVTSMLTGIAIDEGLIGAVQDKVYDYLPESFDNDPLKREISIHHLLTMTSGLKWDNGVDNADWLVNEPADSLKHFLSRPMEYGPGDKFEYSDLNPHVMGGILAKATGMKLSEYGRKKLFEPLGIKDYFWEEYGPDGLSFGAFGLYLKPRDFARIGLLAARYGQWEGKQIVPRRWMIESTQPMVNKNEGGYGYYWWVRPDYDAFAALGHGGNHAYILPNQDMVVILTANPYTNWDMVSIKAKGMETLIYEILGALTK